MGAEVAKLACPRCGRTDYAELFTCELCGNVTCTDTADEQARADYERIYGIPFAQDEVGICCDDCWEIVKP